MLQTLIDELAMPEAEPVKETGQPSPVAVPVQDDLVTIVKEPATVVEEDEIQLRHTIEQIQHAFNPRIEGILGSGGGLLVVAS